MNQHCQWKYINKLELVYFITHVWNVRLFVAGAEPMIRAAQLLALHWHVARGYL